ncbi:MAG: hypothetical protein M1821_005667 [Bathelium mastoideum]|nr:MAG: hypothetical protein M1821_005667 [Bathelium mastoideum]
MARDFYTSSPTVVLQPQQPPDYFSGHGNVDGSFTNPPVFSNPSPFGPPSSSTFGVVAPSPLTPGSCLAGRKRSRADILEPDEQHEEDAPSAPLPTEPPKPRGEPVYGPGMTLVYPDDPGFSAISAGSQTGTWAEEKSPVPEAAPRPSLPCRKSTRLDKSASGLDDIALASTPTIKEAPVEPTIDDATHTLGIGWTVVRNNPTLEITSNAYAKFIENHYPLASVEILLHSSGMPAYLISAIREGQNGFYLFEEDLKRGQLVAHDFQHATACLQNRPIVFANDEILIACRTPPMSAIGSGEVPDSSMMDAAGPNAFSDVGVSGNGIVPNANGGLGTDGATFITDERDMSID